MSSSLKSSALSQILVLALTLDRLTYFQCHLQLQLKINGLVGAANERARRRELLLGYGADPYAFLNLIEASQARDVRSLKSAGKEEKIAMRRTEFFQGR